MKREKLTSQQFRRRNRGYFVAFIIFWLSIFALWRFIAQAPYDNQVRQPLRKALAANERLFQAFFDTCRMAKQYPLSEAVKRVRVNGNYGLSDSVSESDWRLLVIKNNGDTLRVSLNELKQLPKTEVIFDFKCIEGWSQVTHWAGVPVKTFCEHYHLDEEVALAYMGLETPDGGYYVGIDRKSAIHPQTILCYEMNGKPLPLNQGFPLRLIIPVKYGIKHLKRIGVMKFSAQKPRDYWAERGYDYYAGH